MVEDVVGIVRGLHVHQSVVDEVAVRLADSESLWLRVAWKPLGFSVRVSAAVRPADRDQSRRMPAAGMALPPGTRLGPYEVTAQIGVGGMGEVYRATDTNLRRGVAIKVLPASVVGDTERLARFQREAEVLAAFNHPNIAAIYGWNDQRHDRARDGTGRGTNARGPHRARRRFPSTKHSPSPSRSPKPSKPPTSRTSSIAT